MFEQPRHRSQSILSNRTNSTWRADVFGEPRLPRGGMVFTGPDSLRMHRQRRLDEAYVGEGNWGWTPERSGSSIFVLNYAPGTPHPRPKSSFSDAYGWGAWGTTADDCSWKNSGHKIKMGTFRQQIEDNSTHKDQNPWYAQRDDSTSSTRQSTARPSSKGKNSYSKERMLGQRPRQHSSSNLTLSSRSGSQQSLSVAA